LVKDEEIIPFPVSKDHKRLYNGKDAPMTGGMGAYAPHPLVTPELYTRIMQEIAVPTVRGLAAEGRPYRGVLYIGLMVVDNKPYVVEFNARFGDPETQALLVGMRQDILPLLWGVAHDSIEPWMRTVAEEQNPSMCVVIAARGYPGPPTKTGLRINGLRAAKKISGMNVFHASTARRNGRIVTGTGGRVLGVTYTMPVDGKEGARWGEIVQTVYEGVSCIDWGPGKSHVRARDWHGIRGPDVSSLRSDHQPGPYCRWDIGHELLRLSS
jgi:phosphoribosylamine---glycine ligase